MKCQREMEGRKWSLISCSSHDLPISFPQELDLDCLSHSKGKGKLEETLRPGQRDSLLAECLLACFYFVGRFSFPTFLFSILEGWNVLSTKRPWVEMPLSPLQRHPTHDFFHDLPQWWEGESFGSLFPLKRKGKRMSGPSLNDFTMRCEREGKTEMNRKWVRNLCKVLRRLFTIWS